MDDEEARKQARARVNVGGQSLAEVEPDARVIRLDDPDAKGVAVEAWVYLMEEEG